MAKAEDAFKCQQIAKEGGADITQQNSCILERSWDTATSTCSAVKTKEECDLQSPEASKVDKDLKCDWSEFRFEKASKAGGYSTLKTPKLEAIGRVFGKVVRGTGKAIEKTVEYTKGAIEAAVVPGAEPKSKKEKEYVSEKIAPEKSACTLKTVGSHAKVILAPKEWVNASQVKVSSRF
jgi:hypothetical protein